MKKSFLLAAILTLSVFTLSACGNKKTDTAAPTPTQSETELVDIPAEKQPKISLVPRDDGHELTLTLAKLDPSIEKVEYELIYSAEDEGMVIEKGINGVFDQSEISSGSPVRKLLLGTESCTNGCKYKYDAGVTGGTVILTIYLKTNQAGAVSYPFSLNSASDLKRTPLSLSEPGFSVTATPVSTKEFYITLANTKKTISIFSNGNGKAKIGTIAPAGTTKPDMTTLVGDYQLP